jgi:hypothetical protein
VLVRRFERPKYSRRWGESQIPVSHRPNGTRGGTRRATYVVTLRVPGMDVRARHTRTGRWALGRGRMGILAPERGDIASVKPTSAMMGKVLLRRSPAGAPEGSAPAGFPSSHRTYFLPTDPQPQPQVMLADGRDACCFLAMRLAMCPFTSSRSGFPPRRSPDQGGRPENGSSLRWSLQA